MAPFEPDAAAGPAAETIRVLRIIARLNVGGPAIHTVLLTAGLNDGRFRSLLVTGTPDEQEGDMSYYARQLGVEPTFVPELGRELSWRDDLVAFQRLVGLIRSFRPHIVHTHTAKAGAVGRLAALVAGVPIRVHTFHGHVFRGYFSPLKTRVFLVIERARRHRLRDRRRRRVEARAGAVGGGHGPRRAGALPGLAARLGRGLRRPRRRGAHLAQRGDAGGVDRGDGLGPAGGRHRGGRG